MDKELEFAIELRSDGKFIESNEILLNLVEKFPNDPIINYHCAWSFDVLGKESKAVPFYENAINLGLSGEDLEGALLGLGSTYRTLGEYEKSKEVLEKGISLFPDNRALQIFLSMTLYNLNHHKEAMSLLLSNLTETTYDKEILRYKKAIDFYHDKLDTVWE